MIKANSVHVVKNTFCLVGLVVLPRRFMELSTVVNVLDCISPPYLAEKWDNVGLLVEANKSKKVNTILMTNDLTKTVLSEAMEKKVDLIVSYHPPIFAPLKSLTTKSWKQKLILQCIQSNISIYSPHTALDAISEGVNDWLISCFEMTETKPVQQSFSCPNYTHHINVHLPIESNLDQKLEQMSGTMLTTGTANNLKIVKILANSSSLANIIEALSSDPSIMETVEIYKLDMNPLPGVGMGRTGNLNKPITIGEAINVLKQHARLKNLRVALGKDHTLDSTIKKVAVCAGSGASVLQEARADLFVTGEMSHHELLNAIHKNITVILCEHSNSERGFLQQYCKVLQEKLQDVTVLISEKDKDPIIIV